MYFTSGPNDEQERLFVNAEKSRTDEIADVIRGGYCIGCGGCAVFDNSFQIVEDSRLTFEARATDRPRAGTSEVCPFSAKQDETAIGYELYGSDSEFDERIGYYTAIVAGHVNQVEDRLDRSSGGIVTWLLEELMTTGMIDGVIHVGMGDPGDKDKGDGMYCYRVSETVEQLRGGAKSRYYPVHYDRAVSEIRGNGKRYAFVGVPCFIKSIRLLQAADPLLKQQIAFCVAIFCGHFKSKSFAEMIGWQAGVSPDRLLNVDFRVKRLDAPASRYGVGIRDIAASSAGSKVIPTQELYGMDWGLGYFKPKACDWCDDIAGETADIACGDAWLPKFNNDSFGTSIVVIRNKIIAAMVDEARRGGRLKLCDQSVADVYDSQAGNFRHRREGLSVRIADAALAQVWAPTKRTQPSEYSVSEQRKAVYRIRGRIAERSHWAFKAAKARRSFLTFYLLMFLYEVRYYQLSGRLIKGTAKSLLNISRFAARRVASHFS